MPVVRIAELEIDPAQIESFSAIVSEEIEISIRVEPGVLAIYAVAEKDRPSVFRFFEIYTDEAAYASHMTSPHFKDFARATRTMIVSHKLIETTPVMLGAKS